PVAIDAEMTPAAREAMRIILRIDAPSPSLALRPTSRLRAPSHLPCSSAREMPPTQPSLLAFAPTWCRPSPDGLVRPDYPARTVLRSPIRSSWREDRHFRAARVQGDGGLPHCRDRL